MTFGVRPRHTAAVLSFALILSLLPQAGICFAAPAADYVPPVNGPIVRRFEKPLTPYGSGHRGLDFRVDAGTTVVASASGTVTFAGPVADDGLFVTIDHGVIRTSYSYLSRIDVEAGKKVVQGDAIGLSGDGHPGSEVPALHFGARIGSEYIDPEILLYGSLADLSNVIALAPLDPEIEDEAIPPSDRSSALKPIDPPAIAAAAVKPKSFFAKIGKGIDGFISSIVRGAKSAARSVGEVGSAGVSGAGSFFKGMGSTISSGWKSLTGWISDASGAVGRAAVAVRNGLSHAWKWGLDAVGKATTWLGKAVSKIGSALASAAKWISRGLKSAFSAIGRSFKALKRSGTRLFRSASKMGAKWNFIAKEAGGFVIGMGKGAFKEWQCSKAGGAKPPKIPATLAQGSAPPAPNDNIVIAVAGISSHTEGGVAASIYDMDLRTLGFSEDQIFNYSYRGIEEREGEGRWSLHSPYTAQDTFKSIEQSALLLRDQVDEIARRYPGKKVDLVAHSQGGLVAQYMLSKLYRPGVARYQIEHFVSIASPHHGTDPAQLHDRLAGNLQGQISLAELNWFAKRVGLPPPSSAAAREMAEDSDLIRELQSSSVPEQVRATTISATVDFVVPPQHTRLEGAIHYTADMPGMGTLLMDHGEVVNAESTKGILYNALADTPSRCTALRNAWADHGPGRAISAFEDSIAETIELGSIVSPFGFIDVE